MSYHLFLRTTGALLLVSGGLMLFPAACAVLYGQDDLFAFVVTILASVVVGLPLYWPFRKRREVRIKEGIVIVALGWVLFSAVSALPFIIHGAIPSFTDAFFEVMSGYTTTGSTILTDIESLPKGLLFWRSMTHFIGGMGMIVLYLTLFSSSEAVQLFRAEAAPGQGLTGTKMLPRLKETLRWLWVIYIGLNALQTLLLWLGGMSLYDALIHAFGTLATGGYSSRNASYGAYDSSYLEWVGTVFMFLGGMDFVLHYHLISRNWKEVRHNTEIKAYLLVVIGLGLLISVVLWGQGAYATLADAARFGFFQVVSIITTTGFATADYEQWPEAAQMIIFMCLFIGGSTSSTSSGIRILHFVIIFRSISHTARTMLQPMAVNPIRINNRPLPPQIIYGVMSFFTLNVLFLLVGSMLLTLIDAVDFWTALNATMATLWNIGPGFGAVGPTDNFAGFSDLAKWLLSFFMLAGRLDIYTALFLLSPGFWKS